MKRSSRSHDSTDSQPLRCTMRVWDQPAHITRDCGGKFAAFDGTQPRCRNHTPDAIERKRQHVNARVAAKVARANALAATIDLSKP